MTYRKKYLPLLFFLICFGLVCDILYKLPDQESHAGQVYSPVVTRFPYVQSPTTGSVTIVWQTSVSTLGEVEYGRVPTYLEWVVKNNRTSTTHAVTLNDLQPNTLYYYRVKGDGVPLTELIPFRTNKDKTERNFSFIVFGDSGDGSDHQMQVAKTMRSLKFDFGLITGDIVYDSGKAKNYNPNYFFPYQNLIKSIPFFPSLGNHDVKTDNGKPYLDAFYLPTNNPSYTERYYSFPYAHAYFIALDSNDLDLFLSDSAHKNHGNCQYKWLKDHLSHIAGDKDIFWKFVFFHHPLYSTGYHGSRGASNKLRETLAPLFETYGVQMVFNGHDHNYERTLPIKEGKVDDKGIVYIISGGGGRGRDFWNFWRKPGKKETWSAYFKEAYHVTYVEIRDTTLNLKAIREDGTIIDSFTHNYLMPNINLSKTR